MKVILLYLSSVRFCHYFFLSIHAIFNLKKRGYYFENKKGINRNDDVRGIFRYAKSECSRNLL